MEEYRFSSRNLPSRKKPTTSFQLWHISCQVFFFTGTLYEILTRFTIKRPCGVVFTTLAVAFVLGFVFPSAESEALFVSPPGASRSINNSRKQPQNTFVEETSWKEVVILPKAILSINTTCQSDFYVNYYKRSVENNHSLSVHRLEIFNYDRAELDQISKHIPTIFKNISSLTVNEYTVSFTDDSNTCPSQMTYIMTAHSKRKQREIDSSWANKIVAMFSSFIRSENLPLMKTFDIKHLFTKLTIIVTFSLTASACFTVTNNGYRIFHLVILLAVSLTIAVFISFIFDLPFFTMVMTFKVVNIDNVYVILVAMVLGCLIANCIANVAYRFIFPDACTSRLRVLGRNTRHVLFILLIPFMVSGFATEMVSEMFLKIFTQTLLFGLVHSLGIIPCYMSLVKLCYIRKTFKTRKNNSLRYFAKENPQNFLTRVKDAKKHNAVAVVGISCRFAQGVNSKDAFWDMLVRGECGIASYPKNRLEGKTMERFYNPGRNAPGKHYTLKGAFLDNISGFDAQFFGISPAECRALDPQQRLLLEVVYEATEDAGLRLEDLQRCRTGVYVGLMNLDYGRLLLDDPNVPNIDEFASTGITASTVANRISYSLNLTGPSLTVDTACSSSLTALNIAVTHLQTGACDVAIVCAPNLILARYFHTACCRTGLLAEDGRCKSFDIKGDGYGRGEGVAAVVLKKTSVALVDRDAPYAEIVACGLNNDGQNAIPMTGPSDKMQTELARRVLQESGLSKEDIQYVETHGTGTAVGDVVEMRSVSNVYGNSSTRVLRIGSVKSNINHTESTAGLAGLIKVCLMIKHRHFVPTINVHEVKPQLMIAERKMTVQMKHEPWERDGARLRAAAVCCYGYGGTNGHAIVQEIEHLPAPVVPTKHRNGMIMTLSARSKDALKMMARRFSEWIKMKSDEEDVLKENICYTLNKRRTVHSHRLAVTFRSLKQAASLMKMFAEEKPGWEKLAAVGDKTVSVKKLAFIYGGQGTSWYGMAKEMIEKEPTFRESIERINTILYSLGVPWCLMEELMKSGDVSRVGENVIGQVALFSLHYAMTALLKSWGISPCAVVGHSLGEISAACAVQAITLKEALQLVLLRSRLHEGCSPTGRMAAVGTSAHEAWRLVQSLELQSRVSVAVINSPNDVVLSGDVEAMAKMESYVKNYHPEVFWKTLRTTRAFHSVEMEEIKESFSTDVQGIKLNGSRVKIPFYSTVTGTQLQGHMLSCDHWWRNVRQPVLFSSAVQQMMSDGYKVFVEINAAPQFPRHVGQIWSHYQKTRSTQEREASVISTLPKSSVAEQHLTFLHNCVGSLFACGYPMSWDNIQGSGSKSFIRCPTYPWQEKEFWYREAEPAEHVQFRTASTTMEGVNMRHLLLGNAVPTQAFSGLHAWESEIDVYTLPYLRDHAFNDSESCVIPGACYVEIALAMVLHMFPNVLPRLTEVTFNNLLTLSSSDVLNFITRLDMNAGLERKCDYQITMVEGNGNEVLVSEGCAIFDATLEKTKADGPALPNLQKIDAIKSRLTEQPLEIFDAERTKRGFCYGTQFSLITSTWCDETEALCSIVVTDEILSTSVSYVVHPSIIDACFQSLFLLKQRVEKPVPYRVENITVLHRNFTKVMFCHVKASGNEKTCDVVLYDCRGNAVMLIQGFLMVDLSNIRPDPILKDVAFQVEWKQETVVHSTAGRKLWLVISDSLGFAQQFITLLHDNQSTVILEVPNGTEDIKTTFLCALEKAITKIEADERICVVNFLPVGNSSLEADWKNFQPSHGLAFESSLVLVQAILEKGEHAEKVELVLVSAGSVSFVDYTKSVFPWSSTLFGFRRTLAEELTAPKTTIVDLPRNPSTCDFLEMINDLGGIEIPEEIAYRNGVRYLNQIKRLKAPQAKLTKEAFSLDSDGEPQPFKLSFISGKYYLRETTRLRTIESHNVIKVSHACPLLQKHWTSPCDKVTVCGKLSQRDAFGLVLSVCEASRLGNYVLIDDQSLVKVDEKMTSQEAVALCFPMALSFYIVSNLLRDCLGKNILVYAEQEENVCVFASVASCVGADVVCVTRNSQNQVSLKKFGVAAVMTEDELLVQREESEKFGAACFLSHPRGVTLQQVIDRVSDGGKVVIVSNDNTTLNIGINKNVVIVNTSVDEVANNTQLFKKMLSSCTTLLAKKGYLQMLKNMRYQSTAICDVITHDDETRLPKSEDQSGLVFHTISFESTAIPERLQFARVALDSMGLRDDRTYLIVGGIRGFGFEVARWMVENGAKTVICTARSSPSEKKKEKVARLENETKSRILLRQADVTSWEDMAALEKELQGLPEVAGIIFSAMVLEDQRIKEADLETCARVVATKVQGSVVLHQLSLKMNLDFFIMFSSIAGVVGNLGQVAYSAANTFLDALCDYRRYNLGLPALSVAWGTMGGAGILERSKEIANLFKSYGFRLMSCKQGMDFLKDFLCKHPDQAQVVLCDIDWPTYLKSSAYVLHASPRLQPIKDECLSLTKGANFASGLTLEELGHEEPQQRKKIVEDFVKNLLSSWIEGGAVDLNLALYKYGVDSIGAANMSLQIRNGIGALFEIYYFIQPKTNGLAIVNGILEQVEHLKKKPKTIEDVQRNPLVTSGDVKEISCSEEDSAILELESLEDHEKVVPLYAPEDAVVKVFMMHSSHKSALANAPFASGFQGQNTVSLYSVGLDDVAFEIRDYGSVRSLAKRYIKLIKDEQSTGPYYLAGFSFGGTLSFEVASQLKEQDEDVAMVIMLDTYPWSCRPSLHSNQQERLIKDFQNLVPERFLKTLALSRLGFTVEEFEHLIADHGTSEKLLEAMEKRAEEKKIILEKLREQVSVLKYQTRAASAAHFEWQPLKIHFDGTLTFIQCQDSGQSASSWESLTKEMDLFIVPGTHFDLLDQPLAEVCGVLIMSTAAITYCNNYSLVNQSGTRLRPEERLMDWIKQAVVISMSSNEDDSNVSCGKLWLDEEERTLSFLSNSWLAREKVIHLTDIHNVVPAKFVPAVLPNKHDGQLLTISLLTSGKRVYHLHCSDWQERDKLMEVFHILFTAPFLKF